MLSYEQAIKFMSSARFIYLEPTPEEIALITSAKRYVVDVEGIKIVGTMVRMPHLADKELIPSLTAVEVLADTAPIYVPVAVSAAEVEVLTTAKSEDVASKTSK